MLPMNMQPERLFVRARRDSVLLWKYDGGRSNYRIDWKYIYINKTAEIHNKRPNAELIGNVVTEMWPGIDKTEVYANECRCNEERILIHMESEFVFPDGSVGWFEVSIQPVPEGILYTIYGYNRTQKAELALHTEKEQLFVTLQSIGDAVIATDLSGNITLMNKVAEELTGWKFEEVRNKPLTDVFLL